MPAFNQHGTRLASSPSGSVLTYFPLALGSIANPGSPYDVLVTMLGFDSLSMELPVYSGLPAPSLLPGHFSG
ncbi:hypothetical protein [Salinisphaera aquimarina]|uniref:Uncharacterized protein n=1 Tax=Salinisphaera aquimarina TaxID=2094031 RepID=A0ABV7EKH8_9GAMM